MSIPAPNPQLLTYLGIGALLAFRMYRRISRLVKRQPFKRRRAYAAVLFYSALAIAVFIATMHHPKSSLGEVLGLLAGGGLAIYGLKLTKFEDLPEGKFYIANAHIGIALSVLLVLRIGYRFVQIQTAPATAPAFGQSPMTTFTFGLLAGYFAVYAIGLLRWNRRCSSLHPQPQDG